MKKLFAILTALVMLLALAACTHSPSPAVDPDATEGSAPAGSAPADPTEVQDMKGKPFDNEADMAVVINGKAYPVRVDSAEVLSALGDGYTYGETVSCVYDGDDNPFPYDGIPVSPVPDGGADIIEMFTITGPAYTTTRGITVGATRDEVIAAYGENYFDDGYLTYPESADIENISEMRIQFLFEDDAVSEIYIYSPSYSN